ncbi:SGNH/GDSL hydrolase family protein [Maritimibacter sp. UBA3975]|uniref:SGNH/GDSL hydrolase family protein n=1 Tax=Maritimibacter sp. UBA3975 TaxID=1946833 RepID=UPI000C0A75BE|nr:SGNH/GDSL hydrolase family protein [Maritimibacter sp. UBA3975]MAM60196.1 hypothetical protein [Maritimibacter sp.]|tara:strand:- start:11041 stop:12042 length:1002 start_codon:yes stop_codon:yes gene_type:complete
MTVHLFGGSNTRMGAGWTRPYTAAMGDVQNHAIGATSSYTALFRFFSGPNVGPGDVVVWEYALNDREILDRDGLAVDYLLAGVEHLIRLARARGAGFVPVLLTSLPVERGTDRGAYYDDLRRLLSHYGLHPVDVNARLRAERGTDALTPEDYDDDVHYARGPIHATIAKWVAEATASASVPHEVAPLYTGNTRVELVTDFATERFRNSVLDIPVAWDRRTARFSGDGQLLAAFLVSAPLSASAALRVTTPGSPARSRTIATRSIVLQHELRALHLPEGWPVTPRSSARIAQRRLVLWPGPAVEFLRKHRRLPRATECRPALAGLLVARDGDPE